MTITCPKCARPLVIPPGVVGTFHCYHPACGCRITLKAPRMGRSAQQGVPSPPPPPPPAEMSKGDAFDLSLETHKILRETGMHGRTRAIRLIVSFSGLLVLGVVIYILLTTSPSPPYQDWRPNADETMFVLPGPEAKPVIPTPPTKGKTMQSLPGRVLGIHYIKVSPDGRWLVTSRDMGTVDLWSTDSGKPRNLDRDHGVSGHWTPPQAVFSPDSKYLVWFSRFTGMNVWNLDAGKLERTVKAPPIAQAMFLGPREVLSIDDTVLFRARISRWNIDTGEEQHALLKEFPGSSRAPLASPDGLRLAQHRLSTSRDGLKTEHAVLFYNLSRWQKEYLPINELPFDLGRPLMFTPDGKAILALDSPGGAREVLRLRHANPTDPGPIQNFDVSRFSRAGPFSPDGTQLVLRLQRPERMEEYDNVILDVKTGRTLLSIPPPTSAREATRFVCDYSPDGQRLYIGCPDGTVHRFDLK